jgi:Concanavalin A-like lectin/glucanases superfamily
VSSGVIGPRELSSVPKFSNIDFDLTTKAGRLEFFRLLDKYLRVATDSSVAPPGSVTLITPPTIDANVPSKLGPVSDGWTPGGTTYGVKTGIPTNPTGAAPAEGVSSELLRADATVQQGIVTTKGDDLGFSTVPARFPAGADGLVVEADSTQALGRGYIQEGDLLLGLVSHWRFEEPSGARYDSVGGYHLDLQGGSVGIGQAAGQIGEAALFVLANSNFLTRSNGIADPNPSARLHPGNAPQTFACWVYLNSKPATVQWIANVWKVSGGNREWLLWYDNTTDRYAIQVSKDGNGGGSITNLEANSFGSPPLNTWTLLEWWYDELAGQLVIQVNKTHRDSVAYTLGIFSGNAWLCFGAENNVLTTDSYFDGRVDSAWFWNRLLTPNEHAMLWNGGAGREMVMPVQPLQRTFSQFGNNVTAAFAQITLPTITGCGGEIRYTARVQNGTTVQIERGRVTYAGVNIGGVYTTDINKVVIAGPPHQPSVAIPAGTLVVTFSIVTGSNAINLEVNINSSLAAIAFEGIQFDHVESSEQTVTYF